MTFLLMLTLCLLKLPTAFIHVGNYQFVTNFVKAENVTKDSTCTGGKDQNFVSGIFEVSSNWVKT